MTGAADYIIVGSDSGRIVVLEYDPAGNAFVKLQQETFGKSGVRRHVPGQYLAVDPKGRACMLGALDKSKMSVPSLGLPVNLASETESTC
jgi:splicing factor 3B subunit 3